MPDTVLLKKAPAHKRGEIAASLRALVETLSPGDRIPSVPALERHFGVATGTVEAAIDLLRREGLVVRRRGSGTFVAEPLRPAGGRPRKTRAGTLAVMTHSAYPYYRHSVEELTAQAAASGLKVVCHYGDPAASPGDSLADILELEALEPVGFLIFSYRLVSVTTALIARGHRTVLVGTPPPDVVPAVPCVYGDQEQGAYLAARRLLDRGHRRIAYDNKLPTSRRWRGFEQAVREAGPAAGAEEFNRGVLGAWKEDPEAIRRFFDREDAPTAFCIWSDAEAIELIHVLHRGGVRVPEDVSVIGYDNIPIGAHSRPPLDTIDGHLEVQTRHALRLLSAPPQAGPVPTVVVTPTLLCRGSTARPPG